MKVQEKREYNTLTKEEKKIYDSIMNHFPNTAHDSAFNKALEGGVKWDFICK